MSDQDKEAFHAVLRQDLRPFIEKSFLQTTGGEKFHHNWHIDAVAEALMAVERGQTRRLLVTLPPRMLKSKAVSVAFPAWLHGRDPSRKIIGVSYGAELAYGFARESKEVMSSSWYHQTFPGTVLCAEKQTESEFHTTSHGSRYAASVGGPLTGLGADVIIVDDPIKAAEGSSSPNARQAVNDWFGNTLMSQLNNQATGAIVVTMQRLHLNDLIGLLLEQGGGQHLCIPAEAQTTMSYQIGPNPEDVHIFKAGALLDPARLPRDSLESFRRQSGSKVYSAQFLQSPVPDGGTVFDWKWFKFFDDKGPQKPEFDFVFQSWDVASSISDTADYSVCTTWGVIRTNEFYLLDLKRVRHTVTNLAELGKALYAKYAPDVVVIELAGLGFSFFQLLNKALGVRVVRKDPKGDKVTRAEAQTVCLEEGRVFVPRDASWLDDFRREVIAFPSAKHDDQVDSVVQFLTNRESLITKAARLGRRHHTGRDFELPRTGGQVTFYTIGPRRLVKYF